ncbi:MAG: NHL repeat-containing protein [Bryobacteraceae bacterium]
MQTGLRVHPVLALLSAGLLLGTAGAVRANDLYVGDYSGGNGSVNYFDAKTGTFILKTTVPGGTMDFPGQMAIGPNGNLYVADAAGTVDVFNATTGAYLSQFGSAQLSSPSGLAFAPNGDLYVTSTSGGNGYVDKFDAAGNYLGQVISPGALGLSYPNALTFGPDGNLYIADENSNNIYEYNPTTSAFTIFATDSSNGSAALDNLVFGPDGNLYVMSEYNSGGVDVFNGTTGAYIGAFGNTFTALGASALGMAFGADGNLYVADSNGVDIVNGTTGNVTGAFILVDGTNVVNPTFLLFQVTKSATADWGAQLRYAANLGAGESYIDIGNDGANGDPLLGPGYGVASGNLCVNVYAFDATDEQLVSCCSCLVTPNAVVNLGVNANLVSKTLTGATPGSVAVKLVATLAGAGGTGASCTSSAASMTAASVVSGMVAWGTTLHPAPGSATTYVATETPFTPFSLSSADAASIAGRCAAILGNGSTYGICSSCRTGALGSSKN